MLPSSTISGFKNPNFRMLAAIWRICLRECVRAFLGLGRIVAIGAHSIRGAPADSKWLFDEEEMFAAPMAVLRDQVMITVVSDSSLER